MNYYSDYIDDGNPLMIKIFYEKNQRPLSSNQLGYKSLKNLHYVNNKFGIMKSLQNHNLVYDGEYHGTVEVDINYYSNKKMDIDNMLKIIIDSMTIHNNDADKLLNNNHFFANFLLRDDSQIVKLSNKLHIDAKYHTTCVTIEMRKHISTVSNVDIYHDLEKHDKPSNIKKYIDLCRRKANIKRYKYNHQKVKDSDDELDVEILTCFTHV